MGLTALCSGCLCPHPPLAPGTLRWVSAAVLLAVHCGREILFKNAHQYLSNQVLQLCAVAAFIRIPLLFLALSGRLLLLSCLLCSVVEKYYSKMHSTLLAIKAYSSMQWLPSF